MLAALTRTVLAAALCVSAPALAQAPEPLGIEGCDAFLEAYAACVAAKVPEAERPAFTASVTTMREGLRGSLTNPRARRTVEGQCTQTRPIIAQSMARYGCKF